MLLSFSFNSLTFLLNCDPFEFVNEVEIVADANSLQRLAVYDSNTQLVRMGMNVWRMPVVFITMRFFVLNSLISFLVEVEEVVDFRISLESFARFKIFTMLSFVLTFRNLKKLESSTL